MSVRRRIERLESEAGQNPQATRAERRSGLIARLIARACQDELRDAYEEMLCAIEAARAVGSDSWPEPAVLRAMRTRLEALSDAELDAEILR